MAAIVQARVSPVRVFVFKGDVLTARPANTIVVATSLCLVQLLCLRRD